MDENIGKIDVEAIDYTELTAGLVSAYVSNNSVSATELATLIATTHAALAGLGGSATPATPAVAKTTPARIRKSITHGALISFEDGKPYKTLKRHLTGLGLDPETYREKWGLPRDYPMVAASYSEARSALAKSVGLGQQRRKAVPKVAEVAETVAAQPKRAGRPRKVKVSAEA
ncbi:MucR family transcriptional regulator [Methylobacterium sp. DCY52]|uniref:MucR family transcriptional regulator n=1 Tax=Methylobacterium sp. DCY52 TaxID=739139 RepID=UPI003145300B